MPKQQLTSAPLKVCAIAENHATGGIATILQELCNGLEQQNEAQFAMLNGERLAPWSWLWSAWRSDVLLASNAFRATYIAWLLGVLMHKPFVTWVHGPMEQILCAASASRMKRLWLRWIYRRVKHFVFVSEEARLSMERFLDVALPFPHSIVIPNAIASNDPLAPPQPARCGEGVAMGFVGRLAPQKAPHRLLEVMRLLPARFQLTVVGDGPLRPALEEAAEDLIATGRLRFAGEKPRDAAFDPSWQLTLLTSRYEGNPICILESVALGIPFVAPPLPALQEAAQGPAVHFLAADESAPALAATICSVLSMPAEEREAGMASIRARHDYRMFIAAWQATLHRATRPC